MLLYRAYLKISQDLIDSNKKNSMKTMKNLFVFFNEQKTKSKKIRKKDLYMV